MSERNGDRARFQKNRKRKLNQRERTRDLIASRGVAAAAEGATANQDARGAVETSAPSEDARTAGAAE